MSERARDAGYDDLLDAVAEGEPIYLECEAGHGSLPPRLACPHCGSRELSERPLPDAGAVASHTVVRVPTPAFGDDAPYLLGVVDFGPVRLTGQLRGLGDDEAAGAEVVPVVGETAAGERLLAFEPR
jgi:hypothetical protein